MAECAFCRIHKDRINIVCENGHFFAIFSRYPVSPGHMLIVPKRHIVSFFDLTEEEWAHLKPILSDMTKIIERTDLGKTYENFLKTPLDAKDAQFAEKMLKHPGLKRKPDGYNIGLNEGKAAGRTIDHMHIHMIPRHFDDVKDSEGGIRNIIPEMGKYR